jgi:hypothetical protein
VEHHPGHRPAAHRDRGAQRRPRQCGVVAGVQREPDTAPRVQVQDRRQVELSFTGGDLGQITASARPAVVVA